MLEDPVAVKILAGASLLWLISWGCDVGSTWLGIRAHGGNVALERNPIARAFFGRFPLPVAFGLLFCIEATVVALHWLWAGLLPWPFAGRVAAVLAALSITIGAAGHLLAAHANRTGRLPKILRPILRLYASMDRLRD